MRRDPILTALNLACIIAGIGLAFAAVAAIGDMQLFIAEQFAPLVDVL